MRNHLLLCLLLTMSIGCATGPYAKGPLSLPRPPAPPARLGVGASMVGQPHQVQQRQRAGQPRGAELYSADAPRASTGRSPAAAIRGVPILEPMGVPESEQIAATCAQEVEADLQRIPPGMLGPIYHQAPHLRQKEWDCLAAQLYVACAQRYVLEHELPPGAPDVNEVLAWLTAYGKGMCGGRAPSQSVDDVVRDVRKLHEP